MLKDYATKALSAAVMAIATATATAQIPTGYYDLLKGKKGAALKNAVHETIKDATVLSYGSGAGHTWEGFYTTDRLSNGQVVDRYSNDVRYFTSKGSTVSGMNIEHSFPKSWWGGSKNQAYQDLYNLMPCESGINSSKSNYPMGIVTNVKTDNGCTKIGTGYNGYQLWEPADKWKGDFARGYMYMATAYQDFTWSGTQALQLLEQDDYPTLRTWAYTLYIQWAKNDVVDEIEANRNEAVSKIQGNRNPFVDFPNLMEYIWGDSVDYAFDPETTAKTTSYNGSGEDPIVPSEDWETVYTATYTDGDGGCTTNNAKVWTLDSKYGWKGTAYYNGSSHAANATLTSPEIDLTEYADAKLEFNHAVNYASSPSSVLSVEVVCDGQTTTLDGITWPAGTNWKFKESGEISLSDFAGKKIQVAFHYTSTTSEASTWEIKTVTVSGKKANSGIDAIETAPAHPDFTQPYETYTIDGRKVDAGFYHGVVIIKQNGRTWKVVR